MWVTGPSSPSQDNPQWRAMLLRRVEKLASVDAVAGQAFVKGARLRVAPGVEHAAATKLAGELAGLGLAVAIEPHASADQMAPLDEVPQLEPEPDEPAPSSGNLTAQLVSLDDEPIAPATEPVHEPMHAPQLPEPHETRSPPIESLPVDDARFRPATEAQLAAELQLEAPKQTTRSFEPADEPPPDEPREATRSEPVLPGWRGRVRDNPPLRIGIGVGAGLLLGYVLSQPYAGRAERRVAELRAEGDRERYLSDEDARRRVAASDAAADDEATRAAVGAGVIWLVVAGATFAGWWKLS